MSEQSQEIDHQVRILKCLKEHSLFRNIVSEKDLKDFTKVCTYHSYKIKEEIALNKRNPSSNKLMIIEEGCITVQVWHPYISKAVVVALLMPGQLIGDFQFLGDDLPLGIKLSSQTEKTSLVCFPPKEFKALIKKNENYNNVICNLAVSLVRKIAIGNSHFIAASETSGAKKLAIMLTSFTDLDEWIPKSYSDDYFVESMHIPVIWTVRLLQKFLPSSYPTLKNGLAELILNGLIEVEWLDKQLNPIPKVTYSDIKNMETPRREIEGKKGKVNSYTFFRITIPNPQMLSDFAQADSRAK